jgi:predicted nucleic acid-binding protein
MDTTAITTTFTWGATHFDEKGNYAMPEYIAATEFVDQFRNRKRYQSCNVDTVTVIQRRVVVDRTYSYDNENHGYNHTGTSITTDLRWVVLDTSDDMILHGDRDVQFATQKEANAAMRKWVKNAINEQHEAGVLEAIINITAPTAFMSAAEVAALPLPNASTKHGDLVQVRGFGKQRAAYVIEVTDKRVKCVIRTVESTKRQAEGDHGYCKWFTKVAQ